MTEDSNGDSIPQYIKDGLDRQGAETLKQVIEYIEDTLEERENPPSVSTIENSKSGIESIERHEDVTKVVRRIPCGKDCNGCPHGPYEYHVKYTDGSLDWEYIGRVH